jgi:hypothetical protein
MDVIFGGLLGFATTRLGAIVTAALALLFTALIAHLRSEVYAGITWVLAPITRRLPWNQHHAIKGPVSEHESDLTSLLSIVDVFLTSTDGRSAKYQKTSYYVVNADDLVAYQEGVTCTGTASGFTTAKGIIVETRKEHGFFISRIDLGDLLNKGSRFTNVYTADLHNSFMSDRENWTQEIAFSTKHLTLQIHFPKGRPPKLLRCKMIKGVTDKQVKTNATIADLSGDTCIIWEIQNPKLKDIFKLEWAW